MPSRRRREWRKRWHLARVRYQADLLAAIRSPWFWAVSGAILAIGAAITAVNYLAIDFSSARGLESICRSSGNGRLLVIMAGGAVAMLSSIFAAGEAMEYYERRRQGIPHTRIVRPAVAVGLALTACAGYAAMLKLLC